MTPGHARSDAADHLVRDRAEHVGDLLRRDLGVALAALTLIGGFELFRGFDQYRMLVFGMAMVLLMIWRPRGLIGHRAPTVFLRQSKAISSELAREGRG